MSDTPWRVAQLQSNASLLYYLTSGGRVGEQHLTVLHLRVSEDFGGRIHRTDTDIFISQIGQPVGVGESIWTSGSCTVVGRARLCGAGRL